MKNGELVAGMKNVTTLLLEYGPPLPLLYKFTELLPVFCPYLCVFRLVKHVLCTILETCVTHGQKPWSRKLETLVVVLPTYRNICYKLLIFTSNVYIFYTLRLCCGVLFVS